MTRTTPPLPPYPTAPPPTAPLPTTTLRVVAAQRWKALLARSSADVRLPVLLVVLAMPFVRPNLFGERLSVVGFGLIAMAAVLAVVTRTSDPGAERSPNPAAPVVICLGLGYLWLMIQAAATNPALLGQPAMQGLVLTAGAVAAIAVICRQEAGRLALARAFVVVIVVLCASYVVTALIWTVTGIGNGVLITLPIGTAPEPNPIYLPFTPTLGSQSVFGIVYPRFTGLGREPGWMAMYCAAAYFLTDVVGFRSRWLKLLIVAGLIGCISTAGFGVFVVAWAYQSFLRDRGTGVTVGNFARQVSGIAAVALAAWLAVAAPVLGLAAKTTQNATSLDERQLATEAGLRALSTNPLGGTATEVQGGINLVSDIAVSGLPFVLLVCGALLLPLVRRRGWQGHANVVMLIVFMTMLTSQPAKDSTWAFALVAIAASLGAPVAASGSDPTRKAAT
jgi:hypothetical protein